jgi:hypothetical protein
MTDLIFNGDVYVRFDNKNGTLHFSEQYKEELVKKGVVDVHCLALGVPDTLTNLGMVKSYWVSSRNRNDIVAVNLSVGLTGKSVTYIRKDILNQ